MKVGIVGGTGNISTAIVRLLLDLGHEVVCFSRGNHGEPLEGARAIHGDRRDLELFEKSMQAEKFDAAIDMTCFNREDALSTIRAFRGVPHVVHCSTIMTYGNQWEWYPTTEDHPNKADGSYGVNKDIADRTFMAAYHREGFPVSIIKPSTTYGPTFVLERQVTGEMSWLDRIRKGKPLVVCGDGSAIHQWLHVDDAALCFVHIIGKKHCLGQTYNMVKRGFFRWADHHRTAMKVLGREVDLIGVPLADLAKMEIPGFGLCQGVLSYNNYLSAEKLYRDVPEFRPRVSLAAGIAHVFEALERAGKIPNSDDVHWEDRVIAAQRSLRGATVVG